MYFLNKTQLHILQYKPRSLSADSQRPHSIRSLRIGSFLPPYPSRYDVPLKRTPTAACSSRYPAPLGLRRQPQEYGHPLKGSVYLYPAAFRIVRGLHCCSPDPGPPKYNLRVASSSSLAPLVGRGRPSATTPQGRLPYCTEKPLGGVSLSIISGRRSPEEEDC